MKHSKLPWEKHNNYIKCAEGAFLAHIDSISPYTIKANAEFIIEACNEHDTLKAKIAIYEKALKYSAQSPATHPANMYNAAKDALAEAKELK